MQRPPKSTSEKPQKLWQLILLLLVACIAFTFFERTQPSITYSGEPLLDGNQYIKLYDFFNNSDELTPLKAPFNTRVLVPLLASFMPFDTAEQDFTAVHYLFVLLSIAALYLLWLRLNISFLAVLLGCGWLIFHWSGFIRLPISDPITIDPPLFFFQTIFLILVLGRNKLWLMIPLAIIATIQKESFVALCAIAACLFAYESIKSKKITKGLIFVLGGLVASLVTLAVLGLYFEPQANSYHNPIVVMGAHTLHLFREPFQLLRFSMSLFMAFGFLWLVTFFAKPKKDRNQTTLLIFSLLYLLLGLIGGRDHTRILFNGFPFIMTLILLNLSHLKKVEIGILIMASVPFMQLFSVIPNGGADWGNYAIWFPEYAPKAVIWHWFKYTTIVCVLMVAIWRLRQMRSN